MINIKQYKEKEYYVEMTGISLFSEDNGTELYDLVVPVLDKDIKVVIDFEHIKQVSSGGFNKLHNLFSKASGVKADIHITNENDDIQELLELLTLTH